MTEAAPILSSTSEFDKIELRRRSYRPTDQELDDIYCLDELHSHLQTKGYRTIALQFPDDIIADSSAICSILELRLNEAEDKELPPVKVYILADTSYSPCCIDVIAAKHVSADVVVHFGDACLNVSKDLPVIYIFGRHSFDVNTAIELFKAKFDNPESHILILSDPQYSSSTEEFVKRLSSYPNIVPTFHVTKADNATILGHQHLIPDWNSSETLLPNRTHAPLTQDLSKYHILYISSSTTSASLLLHLSTLVSSLTLLDASSMKFSTPKSSLQKRYRFMSMARVATTIGILINTLSLREITGVLNIVKKWIKEAGKKQYTFVVGKPNVPKLANFDVIDIWVVLGCPQGGIIVDCDDFYKPIITPFELHLALQSEVSWPGQWAIEFDQVLSLHDELPEENLPPEDEPEFDPVNGKFVSTSRPLRRPNYVSISQTETEPTSSSLSNTSSGSHALISRPMAELSIRGTVSTAAEHLYSKMSWTGLGSDFTPESDAPSIIESGRDGIARGYIVEGTQVPRT